MDQDFIILTRTALVGLSCTLVAELVRHSLEQNRAARRDLEQARIKRSQDVAGYLNLEGDQTGGPAWLRQVRLARRRPLARMGLRRDEEFATAACRPAATAPAEARLPAERTSQRKGRTSLPGAAKTSSSASRLLRRLRQPFCLPGKGSLAGCGRYLLGPVQIIGRGPQCDIRVLDPTVSLVHAVLRRESGGYVIYDLGSTCGTLVNGYPVGLHGRVLLGGERLTLGETEFLFGAADPGFIPSAPAANPPQ